MDSFYYCHKSFGKIKWDAGEPWWAVLMCDEAIIDYYAWHAKKYGMPLQKGSKSGPHISCIRGEEPANKNVWRHDFGPIEFYYSNIIRVDNGRHGWLDCFSEQLSSVREELGLSAKKTYHLTVGRL